MVKKAVFPVAGLGTRFLPATKASPKEMLPVVDKPLIQYAVEEAVAAGVTELIFVTSSAKRAIEDHFDVNYELEDSLEKKGKDELLAAVRDILPSHVSCAYVRQPVALGLGHAVLCARQWVGNEPFAVILADDLIMDGQGQVGELQSMVELHRQAGANVVAVEPVPADQTHKYGVIDPVSVDGGVSTLQGIVEKPQPQAAPSNLGVVGRYVLDGRIFEILAETGVGAGGEIQLTDAIAQLMKEQTVKGYEFAGVRYDCGSKLGYLKATVEFALHHSELGEAFGQYLGEVAERN